ncbi:MAG: cytochrome c3 family protein [Deltaproteobacteria bacterium]|nr:cytochrome c3 family protein [Deltaproteobacteria bacterium]
MKKNPFALFTLIFCGLVFLMVGVLIAASIPESIVISNKGYDQDRRGPVNFTHRKHSEEYKVACTECHHEYQEDKNVWKDTDPVRKCVECHDPVGKKGNVDRLQNAFHNNCHGCHKEMKGKEAPYRKCTDCHEKKS